MFLKILVCAVHPYTYITNLSGTIIANINIYLQSHPGKTYNLYISPCGHTLLILNNVPKEDM